MGNPTTSPPGAGYVWITTSSSEDPSKTDGYWQAPSDPNAAANYEKGADAISWKLPPAPGASYFEPGTGNPWVTPGLQRSMNQFFSSPTSGYGDYMAPGGQDYGAQLARWQFSNSAPVPKTAPVGWGRYPGVGGAPPQASWVQNPPITSAPPSGGGARPPPKFGTNYGLPTSNVPPPATGGGSPYETPGYGAGTKPPSAEGWMPGPATSQVPANTLSGFQFQNAAPGSVQDTFNKLQTRYGPQDAISYLIQNGYTNGDWSRFTNSMKAGGMSDQDVARITNQFSAGGSGGIFNNNLAGFNGGVYSTGQDVTGLLSSVGVRDTSARDALAAYNAQRAARMAKIRG
jgi:hypothetical protein